MDFTFKFTSNESVSTWNYWTGDYRPVQNMDIWKQGEAGS